jgi:hypothetical protein
VGLAVVLAVSIQDRQPQLEAVRQVWAALVVMAAAVIQVAAVVVLAAQVLTLPGQRVVLVDQERLTRLQVRLLPEPVAVVVVAAAREVRLDLEAVVLVP